MAVTLPILRGRADYALQQALEALRGHLGTTAHQMATVQTGLASRPATVTVADYQRALSASGATPLNLTGLGGAAVTLPGAPSGTPAGARSTWGGSVPV